MEYKDDQNKIRLRVDLLKTKRFFWYWLREYSSVIVAAGTLVLAVVTAVHISYTYKLSKDTEALAKSTNTMSAETKKLADSTKEMSEETRRLADLGIREFKMRAYPAFLIVTDQQLIYLEDKKLRQSFKILNKGELTAHNVTLSIVNFYKNDQGKGLYWHLGKAFYKDTDWKTSLNYETKIFKEGGGIRIFSKEDFPPNHSLDTLKYAVLHIKFKVPYVDGYNFETYGFIKKGAPEKSDPDKKYYIWQELDVDFTKKLVRGQLISVKNYKGEKKILKLVRNFLEGYPEPE